MNDDSELTLWKNGGKRRGKNTHNIQKSASFGEKCLWKFSQNGDQVAVGVKFYQQYGDENAQYCEKKYVWGTLRKHLYDATAFDV